MDEAEAKRIEQAARAFAAKPPGYAELVEKLKDAMQHAANKSIIERQIWEAIHDVFGQEPETE